MGGVVGGRPDSTVETRADVRRWRALPVTTFTRQGCRLELLGVCWARERMCSRRARGMGVRRKARVEWRVEMRVVRDWGILVVV